MNALEKLLAWRDEANPQVVRFPKISLENPDENRKILQHLMSLPPSISRSVNGNILAKSRVETNTIFEYNQNTGLIHYFCKYELTNDPILKDCAVQKIVWRDKKHTNSKGLVQEVVFDYFLNHYKTLVSDHAQSKAGRDMWEKLIPIASNKNMLIGYFNRRSARINMSKASDLNIGFLKKYIGTIWGDTPDYQEILIFITRRPAEDFKEFTDEFSALRNSLNKKSN